MEKQFPIINNFVLFGKIEKKIVDGEEVQKVIYPIQSLMRTLSEKHKIKLTEQQIKKVTLELLNSEKRQLPYTLASGYIKYQKEYGLSITDTHFDIKVIASPTGAIQCLVQSDN